MQATSHTSGTASTTREVEKFKLARSVITITTTGKAPDRNLVLASVPVDRDGDPYYGIIGVDMLGRRTNLKIAHRQNSALLESVGSEIDDKRVQFVQQVGEIISAAAALGAAASLPAGKSTLPGTPPDILDELPAAIDTAEILKEENPDEIKTEERTAGGLRYKLVIRRVPPYAIPASRFVASAFGRTQSILFASACREAVVTFLDDKLRSATFTLQVADANFVETFAIPAKGKVSFHTACGADVVSETADMATDTKILATALAEAKSIRDRGKGGVSK
ncbi:MAG: hypothetical protein WDO24_12725 [Pseudomonadota bacterium]